MKIKSIEVDNHPVLGTFVYSFEKDNFTTLLVGTNGSGKTKFMEFIFTLLDKCFRVWEIPEFKNGPISRIKLAVELDQDEIKGLIKQVPTREPISVGTYSGHIYFETKSSDKDNVFDRFDVHMLGNDGETYTVLPNEIKLSIQQEKPFPRILHDKTRYSGVQINFEYKPVTAYSEIVDDDQKIQTKANPSLADDINKLLVATYNKDNGYLGEESRKGNAHPSYKGDFDRFRDAYHRLFETKEILGVEQDGSDNKVMLRDTASGKKFGIDGLSSGEQQIVYRAGYLLRHLNIINGGVVFVDEPELSLHPKWQIGYLQFLKDIFGESTQFIIATHSPYLAKSAAALGKVSILRLFNEGGNLNIDALHKTTKLDTASYAEVGYRVFGVTSEEYHRELYLALSAKLQVGERPKEIDDYLMKNTSVSVVKTDRGTETLMSFIRNIYHHGQDAIALRGGRNYTESEVNKSIEEMQNLL